MAVGTEYIFRYLSLIHIARNRKHLLELFIPEAPTSQTITHVHIDHSPRRQYCFLVWVTKSIEDGSNTLYTFLNGELIGSARHFSDALTCLAEHVRLVIFLETLKYLLSHVLGHKLFPRLRIYQVGKVVDGDFLVFILQFCTIDEQRHSDADATKNRNRILALGLFLLQFVQSFLLFWRQVFLFLFFKFLLFSIFLIGESLIVHVDVTCLTHCLGLADDTF